VTRKPPPTRAAGSLTTEKVRTAASGPVVFRDPERASTSGANSAA
jgi:hypothetical protein